MQCAVKGVPARMRMAGGVWQQVRWEVQQKLSLTGRNLQRHTFCRGAFGRKAKRCVRSSRRLCILNSLRAMHG